MKTSFAPRFVSVVASLMWAACGGPVETPVVVFDGGFGGADASRPDATPSDTGLEDAETPDTGEIPDTGADAGFEDGGVVDGGFVDGGFVDGGFVDGGVDDDGGFIDGGVVDGGAVDGGSVDGGFVDAGFPDTGVPPDSGPIDTGAPDTGVPDSGPIDTGAPDTGPIDTGAPDTGVVPDTGVDAGVPDAGNPDAGAPDAAAPPTSYTRRLIDNQMRHGQHVSLADMDGDGDLDVVASISLTDTVRLYLNGANSSGSGNGASWSTVQVAANNSIVAMGTVVADFDGDMDLDVVGLGFFNRNVGFASQGNLTFYRRGATINDWTTVPAPVGNNFWGTTTLAAGDLTGDGRPDVVTGAIEWYDAGGNVVGHGVRFHRYANGSFVAPVTIDAALLDVEGVVVVDVDGDGVNDVVAAGRTTGQVVWYENLRTAGQVNNNPTFTRHVLASIAAPANVVMGQLDADPALEAVVVHDDANGGALLWYDPPANPRSPWTRQVISPAFGGSGNVIRLAVGDVNNDGLSDVLAASMVVNQVRAFVRTGTGWTSQLVRNQTGADSVAAGDISGDGLDDVVGTTYENTPTADRVDWYQTVP